MNKPLVTVQFVGADGVVLGQHTVAAEGEGGWTAEIHPSAASVHLKFPAAQDPRVIPGYETSPQLRECARKWLWAMGISNVSEVINVTGYGSVWNYENGPGFSQTLVIEATWKDVGGALHSRVFTNDHVLDLLWRLVASSSLRGPGL